MNQLTFMVIFPHHRCQIIVWYKWCPQNKCGWAWDTSLDSPCSDFTDHNYFSIICYYYMQNGTLVKYFVWNRNLQLKYLVTLLIKYSSHRPRSNTVGTNQSSRFVWKIGLEFQECFQADFLNPVFRWDTRIAAPRPHSCWGIIIELEKYIEVKQKQIFSFLPLILNSAPYWPWCLYSYFHSFMVWKCPRLHPQLLDIALS